MSTTGLSYKMRRNINVISDTDKNETLLKIEKLLKERNWSIYRLSKESEVPFSSLNNLFSRNNEPSLPNLRKICKGFNITLSEFFSDEVIDSQMDYTVDERSLIEDYRLLSRNDKKLLRTYWSGLKNVLPVLNSSNSKED